MADDLPPQTAPDNIPVQINCFADTERATRFGHRIAIIIRAISRYMNLSRLDGVTIAADYDEALKRLDRGFAATIELAPTKTSYGEGQAMAAMVQRDGIIKRHLMLSANAFVILEQDEAPPSEAWNGALYYLAHECGHVHDIEHFDRTFPGKLCAPYDSWEQSILFSPMHTIWEEYVATRLAAPFCAEFIWKGLEELLVNSLRLAPQECQTAIFRFRSHQDHYKVHEEAGGAAFNPLKYLSYLLGAMDGIPLTWADLPEARAELDASPLYSPLAERLHTELNRLWDSRDAWGTFEVFNPLMELAWELFSAVGLVFHRSPNGDMGLQVTEYGR